MGYVNSGLEDGVFQPRPQSVPLYYPLWQFTVAGHCHSKGGSVAEWLACWTKVQKGPGSNRSRDAVR